MKIESQEYSFEDLFNIRLYAFSASMILFQAGQLENAYKYHRIAFYESGNDEYNSAMTKLLREKGEQQVKVIQKQRYDEIREKNLQESHTHSHGHGHSHNHHHNDSHSNNHIHKNEDPGLKKLESKLSPDQNTSEKKIIRGSMDRSEMQIERQEMKNIFIHMIPQINSQFYFPIKSSGIKLFLRFYLYYLYFI